MGANSFPYEMTPTYMGGNNKNDTVASLEKISIHPKYGKTYSQIEETRRTLAIHIQFRQNSGKTKKRQHFLYNDLQMFIVSTVHFLPYESCLKENGFQNLTDLQKYENLQKYPTALQNLPL